jgi:hypothetical protein
VAARLSLAAFNSFDVLDEFSIYLGIDIVGRFTSDRGHFHCRRFFRSKGKTGTGRIRIKFYGLAVPYLAREDHFGQSRLNFPLYRTFQWARPIIRILPASY